MVMWIVKIYLSTMERQKIVIIKTNDMEENYIYSLTTYLIKLGENADT